MRRTTDPSRSTKGKVAKNRGILVRIQFREKKKGRRLAHTHTWIIRGIGFVL